MCGNSNSRCQVLACRSEGSRPRAAQSRCTAKGLPHPRGTAQNSCLVCGLHSAGLHWFLRPQQAQALPPVMVWVADLQNTGKVLDRLAYLSLIILPLLLLSLLPPFPSPKLTFLLVSLRISQSTSPLPLSLCSFSTLSYPLSLSHSSALLPFLPGPHLLPVVPEHYWAETRHPVPSLSCGSGSDNCPPGPESPLPGRTQPAHWIHPGGAEG